MLNCVRRSDAFFFNCVEVQVKLDGLTYFILLFFKLFCKCVKFIRLSKRLFPTLDLTFIPVVCYILKGLASLSLINRIYFFMFLIR